MDGPAGNASPPDRRREPVGADVPGADGEGRRLRILWLVKGLGPGGAERLLVSEAAVHDRRRFELHAAFVVPEKDQLEPDLRAYGVRIHHLGRAGDRPGAWVVRLHRLLRDGDFDVVHLHSPLVAGVARLLGRLRRRRPRFVTTEHNAWPTFALPTRVLNAATWPLDDAHLAVSEEVRTSVWPRRSAAGTEVLVHGTDVAALRRARADREVARRALGFDTDDVVIGTVANYRRQKAYPNLLAAARRVLDACPRARFVAVGQGPLEQDIHAVHDDLALGDRFRLLGYRDDPEFVLSACDVFVLASEYEGYPVALMEAMGIGLPVVATAVGGVPDAVREGVEGLLVAPGRPAELAAALTRVVDDGELRARLAAGSRARGPSFDIANAVRRTEELYEHVTGPRPS
jgi:glycosyltransferase involved in cell wall biosynthesis